MIEWLLERFIETVKHIPKVAIYANKLDAKHLIEEEQIDRYIKISCFIDDKDLDGKENTFCGYNVISPSDLKAGDNVIIISRTKEKEKKKRLIRLSKEKCRIICFFDDLILPNSHNSFRKIKTSNHDHMSKLISDIQNWELFVKNFYQHRNDADNISCF